MLGGNENKMKIKVNETLIMQSKNIDDYKLMIASDFHYNKKFKRSTFLELKEIVINENPKFIVIPGDLITDETTNDYDLKDFLQFCSECSNVIVTKGDSDLNDNKYNPLFNERFFNNIENIPNLKLFKENNEKLNIDNVVFYGFNPDISWYETKDKNTRMFEFDLLNYFINTQVNDDKYNILVTHDARDIIRKKEEYQKHILKNIDLIISGNQGIIPLRRCQDLGNTSIIISRGINSFNQLYQPSVDIVKIKKLKR